jgi:hypothetical protein
VDPTADDPDEEVTAKPKKRNKKRETRNEPLVAIRFSGF